METHEHVWGPVVDTAVFTGNPHRKCQVEDCRFITLDLTDEDDNDE
jgi:allantoicase